MKFFFTCFNMPVGGHIFHFWMIDLDCFWLLFPVENRTQSLSHLYTFLLAAVKQFLVNIALPVICKVTIPLVFVLFCFLIIETRKIFNVIEISQSQNSSVLLRFANGMVAIKKPKLRKQTKQNQAKCFYRKVHLICNSYPLPSQHNTEINGLWIFFYPKVKDTIVHDPFCGKNIRPSWFALYCKYLSI